MGFFDFAYDLPDWGLFLFSISSVGLLCLVALILMQSLRVLFPDRRGANIVNTMLSGILLPVGMVITFVAADVWQLDARGQAAVEQEAAAVSDAMRVVRHLEPTERDALRAKIHGYIATTIDQEWPLMGVGESSLDVEDHLEGLVVAAVRLEAHAQSVSQMLAAQELRRYVGKIEEARDLRLRVSLSRVGASKWLAVFILLFVSACVLIELHIVHRRPMWIAMGLFSIGFGVTIFLISAYDRPFTGRTIIEPKSLLLLMVRPADQ
ncbi:DUF4239 domain-containing protein [Alcaligenaceae bacterium CGII-47]|nr:DUF4239 domain-containing protein [Alcaligenaceae bacterium CGII-47]